MRGETEDGVLLPVFFGRVAFTFRSCLRNENDIALRTRLEIEIGHFVSP